MKFEIVRSHQSMDNEIVYRVNDKAFDCRLSVNTDVYLTVAYLNLGIDSQDMLLKCVWGLSPMESWNRRKLSMPFAEIGCLKLVGDYEEGLIIRIDKDKRWEAFFDPISNVYCIGNPIIGETEKLAKIMNNLITVINSENTLTSIWIEPIFA